MKRLSTPVAFVIGLICLASASSAEEATIPLFSDDPLCRRHQISWVLSPAGMGIIDLRLDPTRKCAGAVGGNTHTPFIGGGVGGGGGFGGFPSGQWPGLFTLSSGALFSENQFELEPPSDLFDPLPFFTGDTPPTGSAGGGNGGTTGFIGGGPGLPPNSELTMFSLLLDEDPDQPPSGNSSGPLSLDNQHLTAVPEPGSFLLLATGLVLAVRRFRRR